MRSALAVIFWLSVAGVACKKSSGAGDAGTGGNAGTGGSGGSAGTAGSGGDGGTTDAGTQMTFVVTVPGNTPSEDNIYLQSGPFVAAKMTRVDATTWTLTVRAAQIRIGPERDAGPFANSAYRSDTMELEYAYTRGQGFYGGEFFTDDPAQEGWNTHRRASAATGTTVRDTILRWRWFPAEVETLPRYEATVTDFRPRLTGWPFMAGLQLDDYWNPELALLIPTSHVAAKRMGADSIQVAPPWDYTTIDPLPVIANVGFDKGQYPDDALKAQLAVIKADGLRSFLRVQVCCTSPPASPSPAWIDAWFSQYRSFLLYHAAIARDASVEAMVMDWSGRLALPGAPGAPADAPDRWKAMIAAVRTVYKGKIGFDLLLFLQAGQRDAPTFWTSIEPIAKEFDFLGVSLWQGFATTKDPAQADIDREVEATFAARMDPIFTGTGLPQILTSVAYGSYDGSAMGGLGVDEVALPPFGPEKGATLPYDGVEQAMIYQAILKAVAVRPHIVGTFPFLTHYLALPKAPDQSIRGKAAEGVVAAWYAAAHK